MKIIIDTNVTISGLLWGGAPNQILKLCRNGIIRILECDETLNEVKNVLKHPKFSNRFSSLGTTPAEAFSYFMNLISYIPSPESTPDIIQQDPFDNIFLGLASENNASLIVSGDSHLLEHESYKGIQIVTPSTAMSVIASFL
ncbi:MAG: putative toxin-antitoxin system toxin component, PIN family [Desulfobacterales bacterium]|nr:putative toxin-antitoxin system toxin component, PIN family [Desulfobacterales bacterium]